MEFLGFLVPGALLVEIAFVVLYLRDRRLVRLVRARHPDVFTTLRGRERRWHDDSDEMWVQRRGVRRRLFDALEPRVAADPELASAVARVREAERWFRLSAWIAVGITVAILIVVSMLYSRSA